MLIGDWPFDKWTVNIWIKDIISLVRFILCLSSSLFFALIFFFVFPYVRKGLNPVETVTRTAVYPCILTPSFWRSCLAKQLCAIYSGQASIRDTRWLIAFLQGLLTINLSSKLIPSVFSIMVERLSNPTLWIFLYLHTNFYTSFFILLNDFNLWFA